MVTTAVTAIAAAVPPLPKGKAVTVAATPLPTLTRRHLLVVGATASTLRTAAASAAAPKFAEIPGSGGVKALDLREGSGEVPANGDQVAIHYYGRLAAKQGWRFDSTYDHKDETGDAMPFVFTIGSGKVIPGIEAAVKSMRVGGLRRVIIPPSQGYQNTSQEPIPPNFFDRRRLFTTIFNPTRLANGEGSTLGTLIFDIELINIRQRS
ncbi:hypothetical protein GQ55_1G049500 [Panicum hallii var. hallii]|uniref:peptidylprolyl isomerase n=1 Tax=Panicum hallii var. hallii TaxID=1504633 RepID=A0A2T7F2E3_9POAL|nr:hypothetical protein GQ55_1G049500 [Panicum hallii var. hallii]